TLAAKAARPPTTMQITVALSLLLISLSVVLSAAIPSEDEYAAALQRRFMEDIRRQGAMWAPRSPAAKRAPHQIEARALSQFKNCYFSPIQCVLMERRRK
ncbi:hypothetical protein PFISCL1PPCAC_16626, partial [Pristionchus fissidentatus]